MHNSYQNRLSKYRRHFSDSVLLRWIAVIGLIATTLHAEQMYQIAPLPTLDRRVHAIAKGVNNSNEIVGFVIDAAGDSHATRWTAGGAELLPELSTTSTFSEAYRINETGQIVGKSRTDAGFDDVTFWDDSGMTDIGTIAEGGDATGDRSFAQDINDHGTVAGSSTASTASVAFTWTKEIVPLAIMRRRSHP